jgi:predicted dehydrogenase
MSEKPLLAALVGFGKIAQAYDDDKRMTSRLQYVTHLSVLRDHPNFELVSVVEPNAEARSKALSMLDLDDIAGDVSQLKLKDRIDVAILATPPEARLAILEQLPAVKAVIVEKPVGATLDHAMRFAQECERRKLKVQVNLTRRGDELTRALASGKLTELVGEIETVFGLFGNGIRNNGTHMVDLLRMLIGEVESACALGHNVFEEGPISNDANFSFALNMVNKTVAQFSPIHFSNYRENGLEIWGSTGRLSYLNGGLTILHSPVIEHRTQENTRELASDQIERLTSTSGTALYNLYTNLADSIFRDASLWSPLTSAIATSRVIEAVFESKASGSPVALGKNTSG